MSVFVASDDPIAGGLYLLAEDDFVGVERIPGLIALAHHPERALLYGLTETELVTWHVESDRVVRLTSTALTLGEEACALALSRDVLVVAHYASGSVTVYSLDPDGAPSSATVTQFHGDGPDRDRQQGSHPHHVLPLNDGFIITDLGSDRLWAVTDTGAIAGGAVLPGGFGPRHAALLPDGRVVTAGELAAAVATIAVAIPASTPASVTLSTTVVTDARCFPSDVAVHPDGIVIVANRGTNTLALFGLADDALTPHGEVSCEGQWPLNLDLAGTTLYVANRDSNSVTRLRLDAQRASLQPEATWTVPSPTWVLTH